MKAQSKVTEITYPEGKTMIGDNLLINGMIEERLNNKSIVNVRRFPSETVDDMQYNLMPIIRIKPSYIALNC